MMLAPAPPAPTPGFGTFWALLGRIVQKLMADRTHGEIIISMKDGNIERVRVHTSYLPNQLPRV